MARRWSSRRARNRSGPVLGQADWGSRRGPVAWYLDLYREGGWWKKGLAAVATLGVLGLVAVLGVLVYALALIPSTPNAIELQRAAETRPSIVLAADGQKITQFESQFREWIPLDSIPQHVVDALVATEDRRFYEHGGVDVRRTVAAVYFTLRGDTQGGSTVTQQLARNLFPEAIGRHGTVTRKMKEIIAALKMEGHHTKRDILEAYLNTIPYIYNATGIERAAQTYFQKHAGALTVAEGALLVGMLKGTASYDPERFPDRARARRDLVLGLMAEQGFLDAATADSLQRTDLGLNFRRLPANESRAPHFTALVRARLQGWANRRGYDLESDGLTIHTTLDLGMQRDAEAAVAAQTARLQAVADVEWSRGAMPSLSGGLSAYTAYRDRIAPFGYFWASRTDLVNQHVRRTPRFRSLAASANSDDALAQLRADEAFMDSLRTAVTRLEAGLVALDPRTGDIKAYVGSRDFAVDEYDHVAVAQRQPGSTFKPFVYAAALARGYSPLDRLTDESVSVDLGGGREWRPTNSGSVSGATFTLADALAYSKNTITVQLMDEIGPGRVALVAQRLGVADSKLDLVPSLALGTSPVTLLEMVSAYGTIANEGRRRAPRFVTRIETANGRLIEAFGPQGGQVMTRRDARTLTDMLRGVVDRGTGRAVRGWGIDGDIAGKTGTTQGNADGWFLLMHPELVTGAWVGFNDQRVAFRSNYWGQGGHNALLVVGDFFSDAQRRLSPNARFGEPPNYRDPLDLVADTSLYADLDRFFAPGYAVDGLDEGEFDRRAYEESFGIVERGDDFDEDVRRERALERLRTITTADQPGRVASPPERDETVDRDGDYMSAEEILGTDDLPPPPDEE